MDRPTIKQVKEGMGPTIVHPREGRKTYRSTRRPLPGWGIGGSQKESVITCDEWIGTAFYPPLRGPLDLECTVVDVDT